METDPFTRIEREARRMRAEHAGDLLAALATDLDAAIRRLANRIACLFGGRGAPCR
jgi:hypothetical protein